MSMIFITLDAPSASGTLAFGLDNAGQIVGSYNDITGTHGFIYSGGTFTQLDYPPASSTIAHDINSTGQIVAYESDVTGQHGFLYGSGAQAPFILEPISKLLGGVDRL